MDTLLKYKQIIAAIPAGLNLMVNVPVLLVAYYSHLFSSETIWLLYGQHAMPEQQAVGHFLLSVGLLSFCEIIAVSLPDPKSCPPL